jgi:hypothetical protein
MVAGSRRKVTPGGGCARGRFGSFSTAIGAVKAISVWEVTDEHATSIEWTETTWNPTTGCDRISPGCDHCYALTLAQRL